MKNRRYARTFRYRGLLLREDPRLGWTAENRQSRIVAAAGSKPRLKERVDAYGTVAGRSALCDPA